MASSKKTRNHDEIRRWAEERDGRPARVEGTGGMLRIDFRGEPGGDNDDRLEEISWDDFFQEFDQSDVDFLYSPARDNRFNKFVRGDKNR